VPLSEDEAEDLLRRLELRVGQDDAVAYAKDQPAFGGVWFDQSDGGAAHYTFTANVAEHRSAILEITPEGADVHVTQADYRMSELTGIKDEITKDMRSLIDGGMPITMVDANARANRVIVYLAEPQEGAQQSLRERYGAAVITALGAEGVPDCDGTPTFGRGNCRQMKGGLRIEAQDTAQCTSAFQAKKANGDRVVITARTLPGAPRRLGRELGPQLQSVRHLPRELALRLGIILQRRHRMDQDRCERGHDTRQPVLRDVVLGHPRDHRRAIEQRSGRGRRGVPQR